MVGETKISELGLLSSLNGTELIPAIQDQSGTWVNGSLTISNLGQMTEAEMLAIATPAEGLQVFNTTRSTKMFYHSFFGWTPLSINENPWWGYILRDEIMNIATPPWVLIFTSGGSKSVSSATSTIFTQKRAVSLITRTSANGESAHYIVNYIIAGTGLKKYTSRVLAKDLSTSVERFVFRAGYMHQVTGLSIANGCYFVYDEGGVFGTATASPNWLCVTRNNGTPTIVDSGVAVNSETLGQQPQTLEVLVDGATDAKFYIDGVLVSTINTTMPTGVMTGGVYVGEVITKKAGTTSREFYVDYAEAKEKFSTFR